MPTTVRIDGEEWPVRRAWPAGHNRIGVEALTHGRSIRAGYVGADGFEALDAGRDPKLPGFERLLSRRPAPQVISHRPGRRAVLRLGDGTFAKCVRSGRAAAIIAGHDRAEAFRRGFALPGVLDSDDSTVVLSALPGVELHDPSRLGVDWERAWSQALDAWALAAPTGTASVQLHTAESEVRVLEEWRARAEGLLASAGGLLPEVDALISALRRELSDGGAASAGERNLGPIHRDLHDKQIMWDPVAGAGLLDVDTTCRGERELDLGNLRAHARWRTQQGIWSRHHAEVVLREISQVTSAAGLDPTRVGTYERSSLVRLACVYVFRPPWRSLVSWLLATAREL